MDDEITQGLYGDMPENEYHADPCPEPSLSRSTMRDLLSKSPAHVFHGSKRLNPDHEEPEPESKFDLGKAAHALLLEGDDAMAVCNFDNWRTKDSQTKKAEARANGKIPMLPPDYLKTHDMVDAAIKQISECKELKVKDLKAEGKPEQTYIWKEGDVWLRVRTDWISNDNKLILDYKTTGMLAAPEKFAGHAISMGYDIQRALYPRGVEAVTGTLPKMVFVVQEDKPPYLCSFISLDPAFIEMGNQKADMAKIIWEQCLAEGKWPGYPNQVCTIDMPGYAMVQWDEKASSIGI